MTSRWPIPLFCLLVIFLTIFYNLGNLGFVGADEPRYARIAEEMNLRGNYVTPTLKFQPWLEKPPLFYWIAALSFRVVGVSERAARFPVAVLALTAVVAIALLVREVSSPRAAVLCTLILATSALFFVYARAASTDMPLTSMLTVAMVCSFLACRRDDWYLPVLSGLAMALSVLAKGPIAVVIFAGGFFFYFLLRQRFEWRAAQILSGASVFLAVATPWYYLVWKENGFNFIATFWLNHHLARFVTQIHHHVQPFWFYIPVLLVGFFPWVFTLGSSMQSLWRSRWNWLRGRESAELFLWLWAGFPFLFFSMSESKLAGYILPSLPPLAALVAMEWDRYFEKEAYLRRHWLTEGILVVLLLLPIAMGIALGFRNRYNAPEVGYWLACVLLAGALLVAHELFRARVRSVFLTLVATMTLFAAMAYWKAAPIIEAHHSARGLSLLILPELTKEKPLILYRYFHHTAQYYTGYRTTPEALSNLKELRGYLLRSDEQRHYLLTQESGWQDLRAQPGVRLLAQEGNLYLVELHTGETHL